MKKMYRVTKTILGIYIIDAIGQKEYENDLWQNRCTDHFYESFNDAKIKVITENNKWMWNTKNSYDAIRAQAKEEAEKTIKYKESLCLETCDYHKILESKTSLKINEKVKF